MQADKWLQVAEFLLNRPVPDIQSAQTILNVINNQIYLRFLAAIKDRAVEGIKANAKAKKDKVLIKAMNELDENKTHRKAIQKVQNLVEDRIEGGLIPLK